MKFIADAMLGRLAKWLRILGFDVLYYPDIEDKEVLRIARQQERTILTRDTQLSKSKGLPGVIFINKDDVFDQLGQIGTLLDLRNAGLCGRCAICNGLLVDVSQKEEVRDIVPEFIYIGSAGFKRCQNCGKVYWEGSHHRRIMERVEEVLSAPSEQLAGGEEDKH